jgi:hypothetical protein
MHRTLRWLWGLAVLAAQSPLPCRAVAEQQEPAVAEQQEPPAFPDVHFTPPPGEEGVTEPAPPPRTEAPASPEGEATAAAKPAARPGPSGWIPGEGFILRSADDAYKLRIGLQSAYKFEPIYQDGKSQNRPSFFVLRPIFAGSLVKPWIRFWTSLELASNPVFLLDSYVELQPWEQFGARVGQQYTLLSRHEQFGPQQILFPEWAPVAEYFWTGRDKGVTLWGLLADKRFEYYAGLYSGSPLRQFTTIAGNYVVEGRLSWNPLGPPGSTEFPYISDESSPFRLSVSLQGYTGKIQLAEENFNPSTFRFDATASGTTRRQNCGVADLWLQGRRFAFLVEGYARETDPDLGILDDIYTSVGVWGQLGFLLVPRHLDVAVRGNWLNPSTSLGNDRFVSGEIQLAYYITHSPVLVVKLRYGFGNQHSPGKEALGAVALFTAEGDVHVGTAQLNLAF